MAALEAKFPRVGLYEEFLIEAQLQARLSLIWGILHYLLWLLFHPLLLMGYFIPIIIIEVVVVGIVGRNL